MATVNYQIRLNKELKENAIKIFDDYGLSLSQGIKMILTQVVNTKEIPVNLTYCNTVNEKTKISLLTAMQELDNDNSNEIQAESIDEALKKLVEIANEE
ncbi:MULTISPECIES: type II toxin-antitoxin system RelB/DinJ family antitoxin [Pasteurellaceae]|nr:type II toxin-antitoxin system RelB/DinJ family antitoxin [Pasteurella atlantica]MBR0574495.1 type II toxin-antitoxin system RelB/DinJ family antitoxin [Pasteurella atlantica]MDP8040366.1 type II toxin-antitoxin system RelB/DinJ family antitoxin [Pasteurella atlantica]MDP8042417.1 type II toxin-antitoxin system RelB/DinJ family antitoxin [Pasteurella atlantica]MDP8044636.1 type II toxin-antitoxin system RelB/DinJ family antitoxin [Pasteurella atlantica]MDP8046681.1 type II toxin-antitoxin s